MFEVALQGSTKLGTFFREVNIKFYRVFEVALQGDIEERRLPASTTVQARSEKKLWHNICRERL